MSFTDRVNPSINIRDREKLKFVECPSEDLIAVATCVKNPTSEPIPVVIIDAPAGNESNINIFNEVSSVPALTLTTIASYTVPALSTFYFSYANGSGDNYGLYYVYVDGIIEDKKRSYYTEYNVDFMFNQMQVDAGKKIEIKVYHKGTALSDHNAKISGVLIS